ncbi:hypothetical protein KSP35_16160 [Aquihabitans sp. G128]|uniref:DUF6069 family protein n=1 Tax=Aquihabitans sp. G128 TaxID=2849779 RepID=UPI001C24FA15|nr:DUF6069 family protein [Aquihabitans sp. G128]QXC59899.1 hypothetical protein KSP35_16160 [Aquihabitans sp. G128]
MTTTFPSTSTTTDATSSTTEATARPFWLVLGLSGLVAACATTALVAGAKAVDIPMVAGPRNDAAGKVIPTAGFFSGTLMFTVIGLLIAAAIVRWAKNPSRTWTITTVVLTAVSFAGPATTGHASLATHVVLYGTHVLGAAIVIPVVARSLAARH